jgi:hypothetical protein
MSQAIELHKFESGEYKATGVFYCSECRCVYPNEAAADNCHGEHICDCGNRIDQRYYAKCSACQSKQWKEEQDAKERERFEKAEKVTYADYKGGMLFDGDRYHDDLEALEDHLFDAPLPEYVWACKDVGVPKANSESIIENMLENMWEDADHNDLNGLAELDAAIDAFNAANESINVWEPDYTTAILLLKEPDRSHL